MVKKTLVVFKRGEEPWKHATVDIFPPPFVQTNITILRGVSSEGLAAMRHRIYYYSRKHTALSI